MTDYDRILLVKNEVFVYKIGPRANNRGYRYISFVLYSAYVSTGTLIILYILQNTFI